MNTTGAGGPRRCLAAAGVLALMVLLSACGGSVKRHAGSGESHRQTGSSSRAATITPLATITDMPSAGNNGDPVSLPVRIYDLRRQGPFVVLDFGISCPTPTSGCDAQFMFGSAPSAGHNTVASDADAQSNSEQTAGGISLLDPVANVEYPSVKKVSDGRPDSSEVDWLNDSHVHLEWVKFPAPPAGVRSLDVLFPQGGPVVRHVPITDGPAPAPAQIGPHTQSARPIADLGTPLVPPVSSTSVGGLTMPTVKLVSTVGNPTGMDTETSHRSTLQLSSDVLFKFAKSNLTPAAGVVLHNVAARIKRSARGTVTVTGYTDSVGTDAVNVPLSKARARSVVAALKPMTDGAPVSYAASGNGSADPVAPNTLPDGHDNPAGRRLNRRVTISYTVTTSARPAPPPVRAAAKVPPAAPAGTTLTYRAHQNGGGTNLYRVAVQSLLRDGNDAVLRLSITCTHATSARACDEQDLSGTDTAPPTAFQKVSPNIGAGRLLNVLFSASQSVSDFYLQDPTSGEVYSPLHDARYDHPITVTVPSELRQGATYPGWVYFPAPPNATRMVVRLPGGASGVSVPLASSGSGR